jgi:hypothetical protein
MSVRNLMGMVMNVSGLINELKEAGMRIELGDDFSEYRIYRNSQKDRSHLYPMFDAASSYIDETNGFWICGFNQADELIHTQAVRLIDISGVSLGQHLKVHRHKYITPNTTPDPDLTFYSGPRALRAITGRVCYHGEFWLMARGLGGPRSQGVTPLLSRIIFELIYSMWKPDYSFAFVPKQLAAKGAHLRYGFNHCENGAWIGPDKQVTEEDYLIWMSSKDISSALAREPQSLEKGALVSGIRSTLTAIDSKG